MNQPKSPLEQYLCHYFKVDHMYDIQWYPDDAIRTSEVGRQVHLNVEFQLHPRQTLGEAPLSGPEVLQPRSKRKYRQMDVDLDRVCLQHIVVKGFDNSHNDAVGIRCNVMPKEFIQSVAEFERTVAASQGRPELAGLRMDVPANTKNDMLEDKDATVFLGFHPDVLSLKSEWSMCTGLLDECNLLNYIVEIPRQVCLDQTQWVVEHEKDPDKQRGFTLDVWVPKDEESSQHPPPHAPHHWYAVPIDHIMATYCFAPQDILHQRQIQCKIIKTRKGNAPPKAFIVMDDQTLMSMKHGIKGNWLPRRNMQPLNTVAFEAVPLQPQGKLHQPCALKVGLSYLAWPEFTVEQVQRMMPTTNADLVGWVYYDVFKQPEMKQMLQTYLPRK